MPSLVSRLKAFSPLQLALVALGSLALAGAGTLAMASIVVIGSDGRGGALTGGDQDLAGNRVTMDPEPAITTTAKATPSDASDREDAAAGRRSDSSASSSRKAVAPAPAGRGEASPSAGPTGDTGGAGPRGDTGGAGPTSGDTGDGDETAGPGPRGNTGPGGPTGSEDPSDTAPSSAPPASQGAPGAAPPVFVVKDADGRTAGTLVSEDPSAGWLWFSRGKRVFAASARTGELNLPTVATSYATDDCTGTPYAPLSLPASSVLRSANPNETGMYEFGQPGTLDVRSIWQTGEDGAADMCLQYVYTNSELAPLRELTAEDRPPTLSGPLKAVRAS